MVHILVQLTKYLTIILFMIYALYCFRVLSNKKTKEEQIGIYIQQKIAIYLIHLMNFLVLIATYKDIKYLVFYLAQLLLISAIFITYRIGFKNASELVLNNMCMLMVVGLLILTRISFDKAVRQFAFMLVGYVILVIIPIVLSRVSAFRNFTWVYAGVGILSLAIVCVAGATSYGAKLNINIAGITGQPSEFVKILFVFFIASMLREKQDIRQLVITSVVSAVFVLILVASKDLGGALLYFFTYLVLVYVAYKKLYIFAGGIGLMAIASLLGYKLFSHVQTRVIAWLDPLSDIDNKGYQISQSLFGIGTGGWFGLGFTQGLPKKIPVVENDFIFAAISEEFGGIFALCLILVCISCFLMIFNISMKMKDNFYRLVALGLGSIYALQVFLTIGGVTKFIPSTGVTLPFVSYGGSSLLSTMIIFGIVQGLYIMKTENREKEDSVND